MVREPQAFLMDEPLSNLDAKLRVQMRAELARLRDTLHTTTIYVTHDQVEAMTLGDRVAVMKDGVVQQLDTPQALYRAPANLFVAAFIGSPSMNLIEATVQGGELSLCRAPPAGAGGARPARLRGPLAGAGPASGRLRGRRAGPRRGLADPARAGRRGRGAGLRDQRDLPHRHRPGDDRGRARGGRAGRGRQHRGAAGGRRRRDDLHGPRQRPLPGAGGRRRASWRSPPTASTSSTSSPER